MEGPGLEPRRAARRLTLAGVAFVCGALPGSGSEGAPRGPDGEPLRAGERMLTVQEAGILEPGEFDVAFHLDNYDRDPLGIDVVDGSFSFRVGVVPHLELYLGYQISRSVSSPGYHPVPSPPLDIVVLGGPVPGDPYRAMYWPMPYLGHFTARVDEMVPGEYTFGARTDLFSQRGLRPAVSLGAHLTGPGTNARFDLAKGSGTGGVDAGVQAAASWRHGRLRAAVNLGLLLSHSLDPSDQIIVAGAPLVGGEVPIQRPNLLQAGLGLRLRVWSGVSVVTELAGWGPVGGRTPMQGESGASDLLGGLLIDVGRASVALGLRWHLRPQADGVTLATGPLAGALDLSEVPHPERAALLETFGVSGLRHDANLVVTGSAPGSIWPEGVRAVAPSYETSTRGNLGVALRVSVRLGR
jgi:hypothetical protein